MMHTSEDGDGGEERNRLEIQAEGRMHGMTGRGAKCITAGSQVACQEKPGAKQTKKEEKKIEKKEGEEEKRGKNHMELRDKLSGTRIFHSEPPKLPVI